MRIYNIPIYTYLPYTHTSKCTTSLAVYSARTKAGQMWRRTSVIQHWGVRSRSFEFEGTLSYIVDVDPDSDILCQWLFIKSFFFLYRS